ncbi:MAG: SAM-dependent methyltransferase [Bacteroidetes bacterium 43-93]|nr:SAM-dependent methyltransferase [Bacteroidota bacterium]OJX01633.1 MAG: SAM-dependent methyltransferase [Bacteroidetes bacterium 43-93]
MNTKGTIYLVPIPIAEDAFSTLSASVVSKTLELRHYFVENVRTARRFLKALHPSIVIDEIQFSEIDKHDGADTALFRKWIKEGLEIGIMSEAGCPGIADPGAELAGIAHSAGANVIPLTGPNSIVLALMASGLNGQSFCFNGYLPVKDPARSQKLKALEALSRKERQTQLFIETPYRNNQLLDEIIKHCNPQTQLCIALNITGTTEYIKTQSLKEWKANKPQLDKAPAVFLMLA